MRKARVVSLFCALGILLLSGRVDAYGNEELYEKFWDDLIAAQDGGRIQIIGTVEHTVSQMPYTNYNFRRGIPVDSAGDLSEMEEKTVLATGRFIQRTAFRPPNHFKSPYPKSWADETFTVFNIEEIKPIRFSEAESKYVVVPGEIFTVKETIVNPFSEPLEISIYVDSNPYFTAKSSGVLTASLNPGEKRTFTLELKAAHESGGGPVSLPVIILGKSGKNAVFLTESKMVNPAMPPRIAIDTVNLIHASPKKGTVVPISFTVGNYGNIEARNVRLEVIENEDFVPERKDWSYDVITGGEIIEVSTRITFKKDIIQKGTLCVIKFNFEGGKEFERHVFIQTGPPSALLEGYVTDAQGRPAAGKSIGFRALRLETTVNERGYYLIKNIINPDDQILEIWDKGTVLESRRVSFFDNSGNRLDIQLKEGK